MSFHTGDPSNEPLSRLPLDFYERHPHQLARHLLGRDLVRVVEGRRLVGRIVEVEVYGHDRDAASHADTGRPTARTEAMFGEPGTAYVYLIYGMYHCLNVVAPAGVRPSAILIRAVRPLDGLSIMARRRGLLDGPSDDLTDSVRTNLASGPGKLCDALAIDTDFNGQRLDAPTLYIAAGNPAVADPRVTVAQSPRIGLNPDTVGEAFTWKWRYGIAQSDYLSKPLIKG